MFITVAIVIIALIFVGLIYNIGVNITYFRFTKLNIGMPIGFAKYTKANMCISIVILILFIIGLIALTPNGPST